MPLEAVPLGREVREVVEEVTSSSTTSSSPYSGSNPLPPEYHTPAELLAMLEEPSSLRMNGSLLENVYSSPYAHCSYSHMREE